MIVEPGRRRSPLKLFVYDHGWDGAEIIVTRSREAAIQILRDRELPHFTRLVKDHDDSWGDTPSRPNPWKKYVEAIKDGSRYDGMTEHEIEDGLVIETEGDR